MLPRSLSRREMIGLPTLRLSSRPRSSSFSLFFSSSTLPSDRSNKQTFYPQTPTHTHTHDDTSPSTRNIKVAKVQDLGLLLFQRKGKKLKQRSRWCKGHFQIFFSLEHCPSPFFNDITPPIFHQLPFHLSPLVPRPSPLSCRVNAPKKMRKSNTELLRKKNVFM